MKDISVQVIIQKLEELGSEDHVDFKSKKFGIPPSNALGVFQKDINVLAKSIKKNSSLALELYDTDIYEAKLLACKIFDPSDLNINLMNRWTRDFDTWEICDTFCMVLYAKSPLSTPLIKQWADSKEEYIKRAAFATIAGRCSSDKYSLNHDFSSFYPLIIEASDDDRNFVKKAVSWALRSIGKRNIDLNKSAIKISKHLVQSNHINAKWIGRDALKELTKPDVRISDYPRAIYRT